MELYFVVETTFDETKRGPFFSGKEMDDAFVKEFGDLKPEQIQEVVFFKTDEGICRKLHTFDPVTKKIISHK